MTSTEQIAHHLKAMGNPVRLDILAHLHLADEASVYTLQAVAGISQSATSQHLKVLRAAGLVTTRRESQTIYYRLNREHITDVLRTTTSLIKD